jgi:hypothetical protein
LFEPMAKSLESLPMVGPSRHAVSAKTVSLAVLSPRASVSQM